MKRLWFLVLIFFVFCFSGKVFAQNISNEGTDFWTVFPTHVPSGTNLGQIAIFVTSKSNTEVTVSCNTYSETKSIPANTAVRFDVPRELAQIYKTEANQNLINRGIHIKVTEGQPKVSAYTHIYGKARSAASLVLPFETLGQTYYSMNYTQTSNGNNFLTLVGVEANTNLKLHEKNGNIININLANPGDVYEYLASGSQDLTGVYVETDAETSSCKRFAAFSGSSVIRISCPNLSSASIDPLFQQLYPTVSWGKNYGVVPFIDRRYILRIMAQEDNTTVTYNGQSYTVNKGGFIESEELTTSTFITADKLISVAQYSLTQGCSSVSGALIIGDPDMVILNPIEFNIKAVTVFSSSLENITSKYINVLIKTDKRATFKINGVAPTTNWSTLNGNTLYSYTQIPVTATSLTLTADDGFNAIAYGFGGAESYAYSAGTNLSSNNYLTVVNDERNIESPNGCIGSTLDFKINLPYEPDKITWTLDNGVPEVMDNLVPEIKVVNGETIYVYRYPAGKVYNTAGKFNLQAEAHVPQNASSCISGNLITNYIFEIYDLPTSKFDAPQTSCAKKDVTFTDQSVSNTPDFIITNWLWDFKDGTTSPDQNPIQQFKEPGVYDVTLSVKSGAGCYSDPLFSKTITIYPIPVSKFTAITKTCVNTDVVFTDKSTIDIVAIPTAKITNWHWDFGDGTTEDRTDALPFNHQYNTPGTYTVKLTTTSDQSCEGNTTTQNIEVTALPQANFTMPNICLTDGTAVFTNTSINADGTNNNLTYEWSFGDTESPGINFNTSTAKDGVHTYTKAADYTVTLTVRNDNNCVSVKTQTFTVNGANPEANFSFMPNNSLCSNTPVIIQNTSKVDFGKITRLEVYKDFDNNPDSVQIFTTPVPAEIMLHYDAFGTPTTKTYNVKMIVYSGTRCFDALTKNVEIKSAPILIMDVIPAVCENDGQVNLIAGAEQSGIPGAGVYSSDVGGTSADGTFNPKIAGIGTHNITYTFNADNGCSSSITQTITVNQSPIVDAGATQYILAGGQIVIPATASGNNLVYSWSPSDGLDKTDVLNPTASPQNDTEYFLLVTSDEECTASSKVTVKVLQAVNPPNTFTPNGDGVNDVWNVKYLTTYPNATVEVFNRNGTRVFFSNGYTVPFDGNYANEPLPVGVYYYIISPRNGRKNISGPLTIIR